MNNETDILFLGSGISLSSGLPSVTDISKKIYSGNYNYHKGELQDFKYVAENYKEDETILRIRSLLKLIEQLDHDLISDSGPFKMGAKLYHSGALFKNMTTYEDLYFIISEIAKTSQGLSNNSMTNAMILHIEANAGGILTGDSKYERIIDLNKLCTKCTDYLDWLIPKILIHKRVEGLDLVLDLAKSGKNISIITLNHDLLIEDLFQKNGISYDDGFDNNSSREFSDFVGFNESSTIKLIKPHGSINWMFDKAEICRLNTLDVLEQKDYRLLKILTGTNKILSYNMGVFSEMFFYMHKSMAVSNRMIMSGYGWGDEGINMRLNRWIDKDNSKLIILHQNPSQLQESSYSLSSIMDNYIKNGKIICINSWLSNVKYSDIESI